MATVTSKTAAAIAALLADKLNLAGGTLSGDLLLPNNKLRAGTVSDVLGSALEVVRNGVQVGRIDNNSNGLRVQAQTGTLQLRGSGNTGISIDSAGVATFANQPVIGTDSLSEIIDDRVAALLAQGSGITLTYNDVAGTLTIAASSSGGVNLATSAPIGWWVTAAGATSSGDITPTVSSYQYPSRYEFAEAGVYDLAGLKVSAAQAGLLGKMFLYNSDGRGQPKDLVWTSSAIDFSTTGDPTLSMPSLALPGGVYWGFFRANAAVTTARIKGIAQTLRNGDMHPADFHTAQATLGATWIKADCGSYSAPVATISGASADYNVNGAVKPSFGFRRSA